MDDNGTGWGLGSDTAMSATANAQLTIRIPQLLSTGDANDERAERWSDGDTVHAWMKQRQGGSRLSPLGVTRAHSYSVRFVMPAGRDLPGENWRLRDKDGIEYVIRDAVWSGRVGRLTVEKV